MLPMKSADELLDEWFPADDVTLQELRAQVQRVAGRRAMNCGLLFA